MIPANRIRLLNQRAVRADGDFVLYWMIAFRRVRSNFSLDRAIDLAKALKKPLVVLEALRVGYPHASDRLHRFVLEGMEENARRAKGHAVTWYPYVETRAGEGTGLLETLGKRACVVVTDDFPCFFVPRMLEAAAKKITVPLEAIDSNGVYPMRATQRVFTTAHSFRVHLQKELKPHLSEVPVEAPLDGLRLPTLRGELGIEKKWPRATAEMLSGALVGELPIDHSVGPGLLKGGSAHAEARMLEFVAKKLGGYGEGRNEPAEDGTSKFSPYLHFGHLSVHQVLAEISRREKWKPEVLGKSIGGSKAGWWQMSEGAESFIDELITWRELAFNIAALRPDEYDKLESLPSWAKVTHADHAKDARPYLYTRAQLENAQTHDPLWNAAMRQMTRDGWFHNYMRMLWGKKILEWSKGPEEALAHMAALMNKYSLDGRNPCSYSGYLWVLGRYDRPWGPERKIFGKVRYMSSDNTAKKLNVKPYLARYA